MIERKLTILYGSQTGNAQDIAERIWRESKRFYFSGSVKSMDEYNIADLINERCVIFICSTTGQGEEPENMKRFWKFLLKKSLPANLLTNVNCAVLGLGDSSYIKFNFVAKRLHKRLLQLGAGMILPLALGDDQHDLGYDAVVDVWLENLWIKLLDNFPLADNIKPLSNSIIKPRWKIEIINTPKPITNQSIYYNSIKTPSDQFLVTVKENTRITSPTHFQDVRLIKFSTNGTNYNPGDVLYVRPQNSNAQIEKLFGILESNGVHLEPDVPIKISESDPDMPVPVYLKGELSLRTLCREYFDLNAVPRRYVFSVLGQITSSDLEREKCAEFTSGEGQDDLYNYCNRPRRTVVEVLQDFPHAVKHVTGELLVEILPAVKPRAFSIASSCRAHPDEIHILVAVVKYKTKLVEPRLGLCSNWLADLDVGRTLPVWIKKGSFRFPTDENSPVIMVGPGTGVAPFRNYILEREILCTAHSKNLILFFGCRQREHDFHCREDFLRLEREGKLNLICAFSRDQEHKVYVQHKIDESSQIVYDLLKNKNVYIFVAGNSKNMPDSVKESFANILVKFDNLSIDEAQVYLEQMEKKGLYQTETWS